MPGNFRSHSPGDT
jgi:ankyrin repeat protein